MVNPKMFLLRWCWLDGLQKIGRRAPVSGRESVEAYTPHNKERRRTIALWRGKEEKRKLNFYTQRRPTVPRDLELCLEVKLKDAAQQEASLASLQSETNQLESEIYIFDSLVRAFKNHQA